MLSRYCFISTTPFPSLDATPGKPGDACHQLHESARRRSTGTLRRWPWAGTRAVRAKEFSFLLWSRPYEEAAHACPGQGPEPALRAQGWRGLLAIEGGSVR